VEPTYGKRLRAVAWQQFRGFWSAFRNWVTFASTCLAPLALQIARHGWRSLVSLEETLVSAIVGLGVSLVGTYVIAVWKAAEALDAEQRAKLAGADLVKRRRTPSEEHHFNLVKAAIARRGEAAVTVLRHLRTHSRIVFRGNSIQGRAIWAVTALPPAMNKDETLLVLNRLTVDGVVTPTQNSVPDGSEDVFEIAPGVVSVVDDLIYPASSSESSQT